MKRAVVYCAVLSAFAIAARGQVGSLINYGAIVKDSLRLETAGAFLRMPGDGSIRWDTPPAFVGTLQTASPLTSNRVWTLPNESGTLLTTATPLSAVAGSDISVSGTAQALNLQIGSGAVTTAEIADGTIVNADISTTAAIAVSKLAAGANGQVLATVGTTPQWSTLSALEDDPQVGTFSNGQIAFWGGTALGGSANLVWDNANARLGIGTSTPTVNLDVTGSVRLASGTSTTVVIGNVSSDGKLRVDGSVRADGFRSADGTAGTPAFRFVNSASTGMFSPAANQLALSTAGSERLRIDASGNVGIGTTTPTSLLSVNGTVTATQFNGALQYSITAGTGLTGGTFNNTGNVTLALSNTGVTAGTYGSATHVPVITVNAQGRITNVVEVAVSSSGGSDPNAWKLTGNTGTTAWNGTTGNFLGTTDNQPLVIATTNTTLPQPIQFWAGNQQVFRLNPPGTTAPAWSIQRDAGGNQRGRHAVDLQSARDNAWEVASGQYSVIAGGASNTASGETSTVGGGGVNTASGVASTISGGVGNTALGDASTICGGGANTASGDYATIAGGYNLKLGDRSFGYSGQTSNTETDLSSHSNIAAFVDVDLWLYNVRNQASQLRFYEASSNGTNYVGFRAPSAVGANVMWTLPASDGSAGQVLTTDGNGNLSWITVGGTEGDPQVGTLTDGQIAFWSGGSSGELTGSNNLFWDASNNRLGVGTNSPASGVHVHGINVQLTNSSTGATANDGFKIELSGNNVQLRQNENADIQFRTNASSGADTVRMRLTADGMLVFFNTGTPSYRIDLPNSLTPSVGMGRARSWQTYSSVRWKEDIRPLGNALEKVLAMRGVQYRWKPEYGGNEDIGFIAEEVGEVLPWVVQRDSKGECIGMDYMRVVPVLVEALKEEHRRNEELRQKVAQLEKERSDYATLQAELSELRRLVEFLSQRLDAVAGRAVPVPAGGDWLGSNVPNPHDGTTTIPYYVPEGVARAQLIVTDRTGRVLRTVELQARQAWSSVVLDMRLLPSGTYEYSLLFDGRIVATRQMQLVK